MVHDVCFTFYMEKCTNVIMLEARWSQGSALRELVPVAETSYYILDLFAQLVLVFQDLFMKSGLY